MSPTIIKGEGKMKTQLSQAILIAVTKHDGQYDKGGNPYILHPLKVMYFLKTDDQELMSIAMLHDVVEDTDVTIDDLINMGFSRRVVDAVDLLTKKPNMHIDRYISGIKTNVDAVRVKMADLRHNSDIRRLKGVTEKDILRIEKYHKMYRDLEHFLNHRGEN